MTPLRLIVSLILFGLTSTFAFAQPDWKNQTVRISWTDNANDETGFVIERSTDGVTFVKLAQVGPNVTSVLNTGLSPRTYYYRVYTVSGAYRSAYSNVAVVVVKR